jgi:hypothetical protein
MVPLGLRGLRITAPISDTPGDSHHGAATAAAVAAGAAMVAVLVKALVKVFVVLLLLLLPNEGPPGNPTPVSVATKPTPLSVAALTPENPALGNNEWHDSTVCA